jgi:hypothetical protein
MIFVAVLIFVSLMGFFIIAFQGVVYGQTTGSLKVYTEPTGVSVYVDEVYSGSIVSSLGTTVNGLVAGTYSLKLSLSGYKDWTKQVTITSSQTTTIYAYLESGSGVSVTRSETLSYNNPVGILKVYSQVNGASVYVGGEYGGSIVSSLGTTVNGLVAGTYSLKLSLSGYKDWTKQVTIIVGKTATVYAYLEPGTGDGKNRNETLSYNSPFGILKVNTGVTGVSVYVDGEYGGSTDSFGATVNGLVAGTYSLKLSLSGYKDWTKQVTITSSQTTTIYAYLENGAGTSVTRSETIAFNSPFGILKVNTGVTGVSVYVDGEYGGSTDSFLEATINGLIAGAYTLKLTSTSYNELTQQLTIIAGQTTTVQPTLTSSISGITFTPKPPTPTPIVSPTTVRTNSPTPTGKPGIATGNSNNILIVPTIAIIIIALFGGTFVAVRRKKGDAPNEPRVLHYKIKTVSERNQIQIFFGYIAEDSKIVEQLAVEIEKAGFKTWYYNRDGIIGSSYMETDAKAIKNSQIVIIVVSPESIKSFQVTKEVLHAHELEKPFLPVLYGMTFEDLKEKQEEWKICFGGAVAIEIQGNNLTPIIPKLIQGLDNINIKKNKPSSLAKSAER